MRTSAVLLAALATALSCPAQIVISQVYGGGGNSGATLRNDFVELFNRGTSAQSVAGWCVQYASAAGTFTLLNNQNVNLTGSIDPGRYYLVQMAAGAGGTTNLPAPDATGNAAMSATAGKVVLLNSCATALTAGEGVAGGRIVDFVGYGTANQFEGGGAAPGLSNTTAALRAANGCTDTNSNTADFSSGAPNPRNSATAAVNCSAPPPPPPPITPISQIQGTGLISPLVGQVVRTTGVVTARKSNGFFLQSPDAQADSDPNTSEGIFIFTGTNPPAPAAVGNTVEVQGTVIEFKGSTADPDGVSFTEITGPTVLLLSAGNPLPTPVPLTAADTPTGGTSLAQLLQLERFEGMRVSFASLTAVAPTLGSISESSATATSNGVFFAVVTGVARPFREPGIPLTETPPAGTPPNTPRFDTNPERIRVDSDGQTGATEWNVTTGTVISNVTGVLDFGFRTFTLDPDPGSGSLSGGLAGAVPVPEKTADEFTVASANLERFFDTLTGGGATLTATAFANRLAKVSLAIRTVLRSPDILAVQEVENLATLQAIANRLNTDDPSLNYQAYLPAEGSDPSGIDVGFLVRGAAGVTVNAVTQLGASDTYINPDNGQPTLTFDRPPLLLDLSIGRAGTNLTRNLLVIDVHFLSLLDINTSVRRRAERKAQADFTANLVQSLQGAGNKVLVVGDYNAFEFNDGYVDIVGTILGTPAPADQVLLASPALVTPNYRNLNTLLATGQRYSFLFDGNAQTLDQVLASASLAPLVTRMTYARVNADFPETARNTAGPERYSDHDPPVIYLLQAPLEATSVSFARSGLFFNRVLNTFTGTLRVTNTGAAAIAGPLQVFFTGLSSGWTLINRTGTEAGSPYITVQGTLAPGQTISVPLQFSSTGVSPLNYVSRVYSGVL